MNSLGHILLYPGLYEATLESNHFFKSLAQADKPHGLLYVIHLVDTHLQHEFYKLEQPALGQLASTIEVASTRLIGSTQAPIVFILFSCQPSRKRPKRRRKSKSHQLQMRDHAHHPAIAILEWVNKCQTMVVSQCAENSRGQVGLSPVYLLQTFEHWSDGLPSRRSMVTYQYVGGVDP